MNDGTSRASPRPRASISRPRSAASVINRLQEALEGTRDRESHLAERVAASVADGHRSPHAFLHSFYTSSSIPRSSSPPMVRLRTRQQALLHSSWSREHDGQVAHTNHAGTGAPSHAGIVIGYVAATGASTAIAPATTLRIIPGVLGHCSRKRHAPAQLQYRQLGGL